MERKGADSCGTSGTDAQRHGAHRPPRGKHVPWSGDHRTKSFI
ncbi:hypothetical protein P8610_14430 [Fictibacillus sp. UD]